MRERAGKRAAFKRGVETLARDVAVAVRVEVDLHVIAALRAPAVVNRQVRSGPRAVRSAGLRGCTCRTYR